MMLSNKRIVVETAWCCHHTKMTVLSYPIPGGVLSPVPNETGGVVFVVTGHIWTWLWFWFWKKVDLKKENDKNINKSGKEKRKNE